MFLLPPTQEKKTTTTAPARTAKAVDPYKTAISEYFEYRSVAFDKTDEAENTFTKEIKGKPYILHRLVRTNPDLTPEELDAFAHDYVKNNIHKVNLKGLNVKATADLNYIGLSGYYGAQASSHYEPFKKTLVSSLLQYDKGMLPKDVSIDNVHLISDKNGNTKLMYTGGDGLLKMTKALNKKQLEKTLYSYNEELKKEAEVQAKKKEILDNTSTMDMAKLYLKKNYIDAKKGLKHLIPNLMQEFEDLDKKLGKKDTIKLSKRQQDILDAHAKQSPWKALAADIISNPLMYAGAGATQAATRAWQVVEAGAYGGVIAGGTHAISEGGKEGYNAFDSVVAGTIGFVTLGTVKGVTTSSLAKGTADVIAQAGKKATAKVGNVFNPKNKKDVAAVLSNAASTLKVNPNPASLTDDVVFKDTAAMTQQSFIRHRPEIVEGTEMVPNYGRSYLSAEIASPLTDRPSYIPNWLRGDVITNSFIKTDKYGNPMKPTKGTIDGTPNKQLPYFDSSWSRRVAVAELDELPTVDALTKAPNFYTLPRALELEDMLRGMENNAASTAAEIEMYATNQFIAKMMTSNFLNTTSKEASEVLRNVVGDLINGNRNEAYKTLIKAIDNDVFDTSIRMGRTIEEIAFSKMSPKELEMIAQRAQEAANPFKAEILKGSRKVKGSTPMDTPITTRVEPSSPSNPTSSRQPQQEMNKQKKPTKTKEEETKKVQVGNEIFEIPKYV